MARIGVDYGLTGQMACRAALGIRGGCWFTSPLSAMCSIYWFAFQTLAGSFALSAILKECFAVDLSLPVIGLVFASLQVLVAAIGIKWLRGLFAWALPLKLVSLFFILFMVVRVPGNPDVTLQIPADENWLLAVIWFNASFGGMLTIITDAADFTRYTNSVKALWLGGVTGSLFGVVLGAGMGAYVISLVGGEASQMFNSILQQAPGFWMALAIILLIVLDNWTINVINLYSGGLSLCHTLEKSGRFRCTLLVSVPSILLSCFPQVVERYVDVAETAGMLFSAIAGILLVDYLSRRWLLDVPSLYLKAGPYWYQHGFKTSSMLLILVTVFSGGLLPDGWPVPMIILFMAGTGYLVLNRCCSNSKVLLYMDGQSG